MIGILGQDVKGYSEEFCQRKDSSEYNAYIAAGFVKFIEQAGARAVPIFHTDSDKDIENLLNKLNGVIIPGGGVDIQNKDGSPTDFTLKVKFIFDYAKKKTDEGIYYPIWAVCQGFEQIAIMEAPYPDILTKVDATDIPLNLEIIQDLKDTRLLRDMSADVLEGLQYAKIAYHNNDWGLDPEIFEQYEGLKEYRVLSLGYDRNNRKMVTAIEHKKYPIYSLSYHAEKNQFVWTGSNNIPHSKIAIRLAQYYSEFFISECRKNFNRFDSEAEERKAMIQNYPVMVGETSEQDIYLL